MEDEKRQQKNSGNITAAIYCRVATKDDSAIKWQCRILRHFAESKGFSECAEYADNGMSGLRLDRPALNRLTADMKAGIVKTVCVNDISRLCRNTADAIAWLTMARELGVEVISPTMDSSSEDCDPLAAMRELVAAGKKRFATSRTRK
jgi:DNA invertase Pin-like site-specific DNA recombinase